MRKARILLLTSAITLTSAFSLIFASASTPSPPPAPVRESCSCASADGSCSSSVSCAISGCTAYCGNDNNCSAYCSGANQGLGAKFNFQSQSATYAQLAAEVSRVGGKSIEFSVKKPNEVFNVGFKKATIWDALELLSEHGTVHVAGHDFERLKSLRRVLLYEDRITYCVKSTRVSTAVDDLSALTGLPLRIVRGNPGATVNLRLENVTLGEIISGLSKQTGTRIVEVRADAAGL